MASQDGYTGYYRELLSWYRSRYSENHIPSSCGGSLRVALPREVSREEVAVVASGRTEYIEKYLELARDLSRRGISICLYDHCGQGDSDRQLNDRQKGYIDSFDTYVDDLGRVIDRVGGAAESTMVRIISHSMGATVAALYGQRHPTRVSRMVLGSPMCAIRTGVIIPQFLIRPMVSFACRFGYGEQYLPTTGPYRADPEFSENLFTSDEYRFCYNRYLTNSLDFAPLGGPTYRWLHEAYKAMKKMNENSEGLECPILTFAAANDQVIKSEKVRRWCERSENCSYRQYQDARHELFMERDEIRDDIVNRLADFFNAGG